jgi:hypothetical protein
VVAAVADVHPRSTTPFWTSKNASRRQKKSPSTRARPGVGAKVARAVLSSEYGAPTDVVEQVRTAVVPRAAGVSPAVQQPGSVIAVVASTAVYSARDTDVTPPEPTLPQQLGLRTGALSPADVVTLEVVVNQSGVVEAAWARTNPRNVGESLLLATSLHAVKAWRFQPALKNGSPVAYRKVISFEGL